MNPAKTFLTATGRRYTIARITTPAGRFLTASGVRYDLVRVAA